MNLVHLHLPGALPRPLTRILKIFTRPRLGRLQYGDGAPAANPFATSRLHRVRVDRTARKGNAEDFKTAFKFLGSRRGRRKGVWKRLRRPSRTKPSTTTIPPQRRRSSSIYLAEFIDDLRQNGMADAKLVRALQQHVHTPPEEHWLAAKQVLHLLVAT